jgi:hypothetical protein
VFLFLSDPLASSVGLIWDLAHFPAYVARLFPLSAVFFTCFFANVAGLLFAYLLALLEPLAVVLGLPLRPLSLLVVVHHSHPLSPLID